jgi:hypothetical protein
MHPLVISDVALNMLLVVMMPIIIWANLSKRVAQSPLNAYLWREHPILMWVSLVFLGMLVLYCAMELMGYFGIVAAATVEMAGLLIGIPMLMLSLTVIGLAVNAGLKALRSRRSEVKEM